MPIFRFFFPSKMTSLFVVDGFWVQFAMKTTSTLFDSGSTDKHTTLYILHWTLSSYFCAHLLDVVSISNCDLPRPSVRYTIHNDTTILQALSRASRTRLSAWKQSHFVFMTDLAHYNSWQGRCVRHSRWYSHTILMGSNGPVVRHGRWESSEWVRG